MRTNDANEIIMSPFEFRQLLLTVSKQAAREALREAGLNKKQITRAEAYRRYERWRIDRWIREHKITPVKQGANIYLNVAELEALTETNELFHKITDNNNRQGVGERSGQHSGTGRKK